MCIEVFYDRKTVRFTDKGAKLPIVLDNRKVLFPWGRRSNEHGRLPAVPCILESLLKIGAFEGFSTRLVPILVEEYKTNDARGYLVPDVVQPGQYMQGLVLEYLGEKRAYVVCNAFKGEGGDYASPKMVRTR